MKRPFFIRRIFMRIGIVLCVLLATGWVISSVYHVMYGSRRFHVFLRQGAFEFYTHGQTKASGLRVDVRPLGVWKHWPSYKWNSGYTTIPFWMLFMPALAVTIWLWWSSRILPGKCWKCVYDLSGNESGICPECGTPIEVIG